LYVQKRFSEIRTVYEIMWKNMVEPERQTTDDSIIRRMRIARWITQAADTHSEFVMLIAFPLQRWLHERPSMLRYTYIASLVVNIFFVLQF
jgi:hypothetical protein